MKKNFTKILLAVPAFVIAASCAKEIAPVQEATPADEVAGKVFTTEFESVKTTLDADRTPVWVEGDAIGVTTADDSNVECPLLDIEKGTFNAENIQGTAPYYAVYPYSADNTFTDGVLTATIPSVQTLGQGQVVASGALVSACKSNSTTLSFKNCVSLLQITIPVENVKKVVVAATTKGEKLTGEFTMDLSEDTLAPVLNAETADSTVTLLPAGASFAAGTYYIAVAPVTLKSIQVDFTNTSDETVSVKKTVTTVLGRSAGSNLGSFFTYEISTADELIKWAAQSAKYTAWDVVNLNADITLTAEQAKKYVEANEFKGTFNGNNHKISGLTTPLFGNLRGAVVKDIKVSANITSDGKSGAWRKGSDYGMGLLAHYAYSDGGQTKPSVSNVETSGSITISKLNMTHNYILGGMVGSSNSVPFTDCVNKANVTFKSGTLTGTSALLVGGFSGATQSGTNANLTNCRNEGDVTVEAGTSAAEFAIGGLVGKSTQAVTYSNCSNTGNVVNTMTDAKVSYTGGVVGWFSAAAKLNGCSNSGSVTEATNFTTAGAHYVAGVIGFASGAATLTSCANTGAVSVESNGAFDGNLIAAGVGAYLTGAATLTDCTNDAQITNKGCSGKEIALETGGIAGYLRGTAILENCKNLGNGLVKVASAKNGNCYVGGVVAYTYTKTTMTSCENYATLEDASTYATAKNHNVGGIIGVLSGSAPASGKSNINISGCKNFGDVVNNAAANSTAQAGGILGQCGSYLVVTGCENGSATVTPKVYSKNSCTTSCYLGGIVGAVTKCITLETCKNYGEIKNSGLVNGASTSYYRLGGIIGNSVNASPGTDTGVVQQGVYTDCENYGDIVNDSNSTQEVRLGGIIGTSSSAKAMVSGCKNFGNLLETENVTAQRTDASFRMGGIHAHCGNAGSKFVNCVSKANLSPRGTTAYTHIGEILGHYDSGTAMADFSNNRIAGSVNGVAVTETNFKDKKILYGTSNWAIPEDKLNTCSLYTE